MVGVRCGKCALIKKCANISIERLQYFPVQNGIPRCYKPIDDSEILLGVP